jgi:hypothetical protein
MGNETVFVLFLFLADWQYWCDARACPLSSCTASYFSDQQGHCSSAEVSVKRETRLPSWFIT